VLLLHRTTSLPYSLICLMPRRRGDPRRSDRDHKALAETPRVA